MENETTVINFNLIVNCDHLICLQGKLIIDGKQMETNLFKMIKETQINSNPNNIIAFSDNSSAIKGFNDLHIMVPKESSQSSEVTIKPKSTRHVVFTAETHNFPTGVAPFQGATTGNQLIADLNCQWKCNLILINSIVSFGVFWLTFNFLLLLL